MHPNAQCDVGNEPPRLQHELGHLMWEQNIVKEGKAKPAIETTLCSQASFQTRSTADELIHGTNEQEVTTTLRSSTQQQ